MKKKRRFLSIITATLCIVSTLTATQFVNATENIYSASVCSSAEN